MKLRARKIKHILEDFLDVSRSREASTKRYRSGHLETGMASDDGLDFVYSFSEAFPGRALDPNHINAAARVRNLLHQMVEVGVVNRFIIGTYKDFIGESGGWCYSYRLNETILNDIKYEVRSIDEVAEETDRILSPQTDL